MAKNKMKEEDRKKLVLQIHEWNANRYDLFAITPPNEEDEFFGVMRFFFQEANQRVSTKCIRVSNTASSIDVINTLVEKFRPDMRMLSLPTYALYEVHVNGEERKLKEDEFPLVVQLNWGQDDREGRFLLKNMDEKTYLPKTDSITNTTEAPAAENGGFKRKLSKREKKEQKKRDKEMKLKDKENKSPAGDGVAGKLYNEVPDTSFTRSISNPEAVMRKRRQLKLEKKLQQIRSKDGGPDQGGTLKIFGESIRPDIPYKTLLLSTNDTTAFVVKETLDKYGLEKEDPRNFCLIQTLLPPGGPEYHDGSSWGLKEFILDEDDCPLAIVMHTPPNQGTVMFQLKRRTAEMPQAKKKRSASATRLDTREKYSPQQADKQKLPFLVEIQPDGTEPYKARTFQLLPNGIEVGSDQGVNHNGQYMQLHGPDIAPRHCVFTFTEGLVTVTPIQREAETFVNDKRILETTILQHGMVLRFGRMHLYRYCDPNADKVVAQMPVGKGAPLRGPQGDVENFETTFDVDGHIETKAAVTGPHGEGPHVPIQEDLLPCSIEYREEGEEAFLRMSVKEVNGNNIQFKLAPTYTMYMAMRYRVQKLGAMEMNPTERGHWLNAFTTKIINTIHHTVQASGGNASALSFWMANSSELLHFLKQDRDVCIDTKPCQDQLAQVVQTAFHQLVDCMQADLHQVMNAFLDESMEDLQAENEMAMYPRGKPTIADVLQVLSSAMSLLRRCRVNAALTIQLFSQLFHFINMWLFNKLVLQPQLELCTASWGHKLKRRLGRVEIWAEKHGLELAADCHLARIIQAAHLLETPKGNTDDSANISSTCFKLNSLQLRTLLESYIPAPNEPRIPSELLSRVVSVAQSMSDELLRSEGRDVRLEEDPDLQLPFLLPEDGYSCDIVKGVPGGLPEFLAPMTKSGLCRFTVSQNSFGSWTAYMGQASPQQMELGRDAPPMMMQPQSPESLPIAMPQLPEVLKVTFNKVNRSIGLSIVATKGENQADRGIYVKSVVAGGGAALDGRLQAGDQLLKVDGQSLVGLTQEKAAEIMMHTGQTVTLEVAKQGAIYHGLTSLLTQQSPIMMRGGPGAQASPGVQKTRPRSENLQQPDSPYRDATWGRNDSQRPLQMQHGARSSPNIPNVGEGDPRHPDYRQPGRQGQPPVTNQKPSNQKYMGPDPVKSKSTTNLDYRDQPEQQPANRTAQPSMPQYQSHPDLNRSERDKTYENYPAVDRYRGTPNTMPPQPHGAAPDDRDMRNAKSLGNLHQGEPPKQDMGNRAHSGDFDRRLMQQGKPPEQGKPQEPTQPQWQQGKPQEPTQPQWQQNKPQEPQPRRRPGWGIEAPNQTRDIPRSQTSNQQYQPNFYQNTQTNSPSNLPMNQMRIADQRGTSPEKPINTQQQQQPQNTRQNVPRDVPKVDVDPSKTQSGFFDGRQPQQRPQNAYPDEFRYRDPEPNDMRSVQTTPLSVGHMYQKKETSPDLPPPPPSVLPPEDDMDLPPPPSTQDRNQHLRGDLDRMRPRERGQSPPISQSSPMIHTSPMKPNMPGIPQSRPPQQQINSTNYNVNIDPQKYTSPMGPESQQNQLYHYVPRPAPASAVDRSIHDVQQSIGPDITARFKAPNQPAIQKKPPPVSSKPPQLAPKPVPKIARDSSPWSRQEKEIEKVGHEKEVRLRRQYEIREFESRPDLSQEEQERLQRLRLDEEFEKRVQEAATRNEDDDDDDDPDITRSAMGRAKVLEMMQRDVDRRQKQMQEDNEQRKYLESKAETEKIERQERRLAQFEQERQEEKMRQLKRQEKKAQETEEYLRKQRELRESQRMAFDEQKRIQKEEQDKIEERRKEELRKIKEMERDQMREIQAAREAEEKHMRNVIRRQDQERVNTITSDKYSPMAYDDNSRPGYKPLGPPPPAPPERKSSRDIYGNRPVSMTNLGTVEDPGGPMKSSISSSAIPLQQQELYSKKSVSFDTNLTREIQLSRQSSASSDLSYRQNSTSSELNYGEYQSQSSQDMHQPYQAGYPATSHPPTTNMSSSNPSFQRPNYGQSPSTPYSQYGQESSPRTPQMHSQNMSMADTPGAGTPGVIGMQEVYRDPRDRITASRLPNSTPSNEPQRMSFRDKMKMFAKEAGENTPQERSRISRAQQELESQYTTP